MRQEKPALGHSRDKKKNEQRKDNIRQWRSQNAEKSYAHQRETTISSNDSLQLRPFSKWKLL